MYEEMLISALITGLTVFIGTYVMSKRMISNGKQELFAWLNSESGQKTIYSIGYLVSQGFRKGIGFGAGKGKMKWEDIAMQMASGWMQKQGWFGTPQPQEQTESPISTKLP